MKSLLFTLSLFIFLHQISFSQCFEIQNRAGFSEEIKKFHDLDQYHDMEEGEVKGFRFNNKGKNGAHWRSCKVKIKKINGTLETFVVGECKSYNIDKIYHIAQYDSCGKIMREEYYRNLDTVKTRVITYQDIEIEGESYRWIGKEERKKRKQIISGEVELPDGKRKRHGIYRKTVDGEIKVDKEYYMGKVVSNNLKNDNSEVGNE